MYLTRSKQNVFQSMNALLEVIHSLNKEESRFFKLYAGRTNSSGERKDLMLFDAFKRSGEPDEDKIATKLYGGNKNAYYRLKNRLLSDLNKSLMLQHISNEADLSILQSLLLARIFKQKRKYKIAISYLHKAEKKATQIEAFELLNIIFNELIKMSHDDASIDVEHYIEERKSNNKRLYTLQEIDDILAAVMYRVRTAQNFSGKNAAILELLEKTVGDFSQNTDIKTSGKLRIKIYQAVSRVLLQRHDFTALEEYLKHTLDDFHKDKLFNKQTHEVKLQMLTYLINCLFKNNKLGESLKRTEELRSGMNQFDGFLHDKFLFYYYNSLVINYSRLDKDKAIEILEQAKTESIIKQSNYNYFFVYSNLALMYFDKGRFKPAIKHLSRIMLHEGFLDFARSFQIKIMAAELIIRYEIGDFDYLEKRIKQVKKDYQDLLGKSEFEREVLLLKILGELVYTSNIKSNEKLMGFVTSLLNKLSQAEADDADVLNYNKWLSDKL